MTRIMLYQNKTKQSKIMAKDGYLLTVLRIILGRGLYLKLKGSIL